MAVPKEAELAKSGDFSAALAAADEAAQMVSRYGLEEVTLEAPGGYRVTVRRSAEAAPVQVAAPVDMGALARDVMIGEDRGPMDILDEPDDPTTGDDGPTLAQQQVTS